MTEDDLISLGLQAEAILRDEGFNALFAAILERNTRAILETNIDQKDLRDTLYLTVHGMKMFVGELKQYSAAKENIRIRREAEEAAKNDDF